MIFQMNAKPLYVVHDNDSVLVSNTSKSLLWKFNKTKQKFSSFIFDGKATTILTLDNDKNV